MSKIYDIDEVITVDETVETGYFYLENRQFYGPFESVEQASEAALQNCKLSSPGECRAIYHGSARRDQSTRLNEPLSNMHQTATVECPA